MIPAIAAAARVLAAGSTRAIAASSRVLAGAGLRLGAITARVAVRLGNSARLMFKPKRVAGKQAVLRVNARKAIKKLDRFEEIIEEVTKDALPIMKANTARDTGYARRNTKYDRSSKSLIATYEYATYLDRPNYQKNNVSAEGRQHGITKPTKKWIEKEIVKRVKRELGR